MIGKVESETTDLESLADKVNELIDWINAKSPRNVEPVKIKEHK